MSKSKPEFDEFVKNYRAQQNAQLWLSGDTSEFFAQYKAAKLAEWLQEMQFKHNKILDFGCGDGLMTNYLARYFSNSKVVGCDISEESIRTAQQLYPHLEFVHIQKDLNKFEPQSFDLIMAAGVFHHIKFNQHAQWLAHIFRTLKPGGIFALLELNPINPATTYMFKNHPMEQDAKMLTHRYSKKLLQPFGSTKTYFYSFFPSWFKNLRFLEPLLTWCPLGALYACLTTKLKSKS